METYAKNHFAFNRWILQCAGLWAPEDASKLTSLLYKCYAVFVFCFVNIYFTLTEMYSFFETYHHLDLFIKNLNFALTHLMGAIKCAFWFRRGSYLIAIIRTLEQPRFQYVQSETFNPGKISVDAKRRGFKYTMAFFLLAHMTLSSSYIPSGLMAVFRPTYVLDTHGNATFVQQLPYFSWIPFKHDTPTTYIFALVYQAGPMVSYAYSIVGMDTLFMNIMNYLACHLQILSGAFATVVQRSKQQPERELKKCIVHLQTVIRMCEKLEDVHKYLTLGQVMATLFILCTSLFLVSTTPVASKQFAAESVYMIAMGFQLVLYCWFGNQVTLGASEIPMALWKCDWLSTTKSFKACMLITMIRMKKPIYLTVGKFAPLTLATYVAILKGSYSFFAVLKKAND